MGEGYGSRLQDRQRCAFCQAYRDRRLLDNPRYEKYSQRLAYQRGIRKYVYRLDVLERMLSYDEVTDIFVRVNSLGAKQRSSDLALAQITAKWLHSLQTFRDFQGASASVCFLTAAALMFRCRSFFSGRED